MRFLAGSTIIATMLLSLQAIAQAGAAEAAGTWLTEDGRAKIRTELCGEGGQKLCGYVVWLKSPLDDKGQPRTDLKNPDPAKRSRPSLGMELMSGLKPDDPTHFAGEIYNAEDGKMYSVTVSIESNTELRVHGCLLHFLCGSQAWTRVTDIALPTAAKAESGVKVVKASPLGLKHDSAPSTTK